MGFFQFWLIKLDTYLTNFQKHALKFFWNVSETFSFYVRNRLETIGVFDRAKVENLSKFFGNKNISFGFIDELFGTNYPPPHVCPNFRKNYFFKLENRITQRDAKKRLRKKKKKKKRFIRHCKTITIVDPIGIENAWIVIRVSGIGRFASEHIRRPWTWVNTVRAVLTDSETI